MRRLRIFLLAAIVVVIVALVVVFGLPAIFDRGQVDPVGLIPTQVSVQPTETKFSQPTVDAAAERTVIAYTAIPQVQYIIVTATPSPVPKAGKFQNQATNEPTLNGISALNQAMTQTLAPVMTQIAATIGTPANSDQAVPGSPTFSVEGAPQNVALNIVARASGQFVNKTGLGTELVFADPGKLLVGPEFPDATIRAAGGSIARINPDNQFVLENQTGTANCPEGGFLLVTAGRLKADAGWLKIQLDGPNTHGWMMVIRCPNADGSTPADRNLNVNLEVVAGNALVMRYPGSPAGGFISEGQFLQIMQKMVSGITSDNCGLDACKSGSVIVLDWNNGAYSVANTTDAKTFASLGANWDFSQ